MTSNISNSSQTFHATQWESNPTVDLFLKGLSDDVETTVNSVIEAKDNNVMKELLGSSQNIAVAIANAKNVYADYMQMTVDKVEQTVQSKLQEVGNFVNILQQRNPDLLNDIVQRVNDYINSLPFSKIQPRLDSVTPQCIVLDSKAEVKIDCQGFFPNSDDQKFTPSLSFRNDFKLISATKEKISFLGLVKDIFPQVPYVDKYSYAVGNLKIPYDNTSNLLPNKEGQTDIKTFEYRVLENALPMSPGKVTAIYTFCKDGTPVQKPYVSKTFHEDGWASFGRKGCSDWGTKNYTLNPDDGFQFIVGTQSLSVAKGAHGNHSQRITSASTNAINVQIRLDSCGGKHNGIIDWHVEANQIMPTIVMDSRQDLVNINWGETKEVPLNVNGSLFKIAFSAFDGSYSEFGTEEDLSNRYIKVFNEGSKLRITAVLPDDMTMLKV